MPATSLPKFLVLYGALFAAFGVASPFLPGLLQQRGLGPAEIGVVLAAGTTIRLLAGPAGCRVADRLTLRRRTLAILTAAAAGVATFYLLPGAFWTLLAVGVLHAATLAPIVPLADTLALGAAQEAASGRFEYGWVRGAGSAAFIVGAIGAGQAIEGFGLVSMIWLNAGLLALAVLAVRRVPDAVPVPVAVREASDARALLLLPGFMRLMIVAALVQGSHAMHDGFAVLRWREAGIGPGTAGLLWSEAVLAEVLVFVLLGPALLRRLGPRGAMMLAALAGVVRWSVTSFTAWLPAVALVQPLHGLTFALLHLACMRMLVGMVPPNLAATAQAVYGTVAVGAMTASLTLVSGDLYGRFGALAFLAMAALCAAALPVAWALPVGRSPCQQPCGDD